MVMHALPADVIQNPVFRLVRCLKGGDGEDGVARAWLSDGYAERVVRDLEKRAGHPVTDAAKTVEVISGRLRCTAAAQVQGDGDTAWDPENSALEALRLATVL